MADIAPKNGEYLDGKLWFQRRGSMITLGLTNAAVEDVGTVESIEFPNEGDDYEKGEILATVSGSNGTIELITPATGIIKELNEVAKEQPDTVSDDPLEEGWLVKLEIEDTSDLKEYGEEI